MTLTITEETPIFLNTENRLGVFSLADQSAGLLATVTIGNTVRSHRALGPIRIIDQSPEQSISHTIAVARALTEKCALANLDGAGLSVVIQGDPKIVKTPAVLASLNEGLNILQEEIYLPAHGKRIEIVTGLDIGFTEEDHGWAEPLLDSYPKGAAHGESTAIGLLAALKVAVRHRLERDSLEGLQVGVLGAGKVGYPWCRLLTEAGAKIFVYDHSRQNLERAQDQLGATIAHNAEQLLAYNLDVLSPCGFGPVFKDSSEIERLRVKIVLGSANNQLGSNSEDLAEALNYHNVLYCPDASVNAGGVIASLYNHDPEERGRRLQAIGDNLALIIEAAANRDVSPYLVAQEIVKARLTPTAAPAATQPDNAPQP